MRKPTVEINGDLEQPQRRLSAVRLDDAGLREYRVVADEVAFMVNADPRTKGFLLTQARRVRDAFAEDHVAPMPSAPCPTVEWPGYRRIDYEGLWTRPEDEVLALCCDGLTTVHDTFYWHDSIAPRSRNPTGLALLGDRFGDPIGWGLGDDLAAQVLPIFGPPIEVAREMLARLRKWLDGRAVLPKPLRTGRQVPATQATLRTGESGPRGAPEDATRAVPLRYAAKNWFGCADETLRSAIAAGVYRATRLSALRFVFDVDEVVGVGKAETEDLRHGRSGQRGLGSRAADESGRERTRNPRR